MDARILTTLSTDLLKACVDAYAQVPAAGEPPERRYVTHGPAVAAGDQLTVAVSGFKVSQPFPTTQTGPIQRSAVGAAELTVELYRRCWPVPDLGPASSSLPSAESLTDAASLLAEDAATVWLWVAGLASLGNLFPSVDGLIGVGDTAALPMLPVPVSGQVAGWRWPIVVKLAIP